MQLPGLCPVYAYSKAPQGCGARITVIQIRSCCRSLAASNDTAHSTRCLQRLNDTICIENGYSRVAHRKSQRGSHPRHREDGAYARKRKTDGCAVTPVKAISQKSRSSAEGTFEGLGDLPTSKNPRSRKGGSVRFGASGLPEALLSGSNTLGRICNIVAPTITGIIASTNSAASKSATLRFMLQTSK